MSGIVRGNCVKSFFSMRSMANVKEFFNMHEESILKGAECQ